jgi:hypothetical protein
MYIFPHDDGRTTETVADDLNKIVNNYWNRVALDGNPWTWSTTRNRTQTTKLKKSSLYLDIIEREETDHGVVLSFIPILVNLASHEYYVPSPEAELPANTFT